MANPEAQTDLRQSFVVAAPILEPEEEAIDPLTEAKERTPGGITWEVPPGIQIIKLHEAPSGEAPIRFTDGRETVIACPQGHTVWAEIEPLDRATELRLPLTVRISSLRDKIREQRHNRSGHLAPVASIQLFHGRGVPTAKTEHPLKSKEMYPGHPDGLDLSVRGLHLGAFEYVPKVPVAVAGS